MTFSSEEIERYKRHLVLHKVGGAGQQKLKAAKVLVIGAGGLGAPVLSYLAAAGIGTLGIIDGDQVSLSNLQRQIIHNTSAVGQDKTKSAAQSLAEINPHVAVVEHNHFLTRENALEIISQYDLVADGSDNFETRYLVNDACYFAKKPLVFAALGPFDGHLTTFRSFEKDGEGNPLPNYRCLFPTQPEEGTVANCAEVGILGAIAGVVGTLQAVEVLKELLGLGWDKTTFSGGLVGKLMLYDALSLRFETIRYNWDKDNPLSGKAPTILSL